MLRAFLAAGLVDHLHAVSTPSGVTHLTFTR
jgi:hypothetical protein